MMLMHRELFIREEGLTKPALVQIPLFIAGTTVTKAVTAVART
jgi:hypothetical protein